MLSPDGVGAQLPGWQELPQPSAPVESPAGAPTSGCLQQVSGETLPVAAPGAQGSSVLLPSSPRARVCSEGPSQPSLSPVQPSIWDARLPSSESIFSEIAPETEGPARC